jgi:dTDP-L-rhamnose 4-epimerase
VVGVENSAADLALYAGNNDLGTTALLGAMTESGCTRLVLASSMVVYGEGHYRCERHGPCPPTGRSPEDLAAGRFDHQCPVCGSHLVVEPVDEAAALLPRSGYAASKVAQEHYAAAWARLTGGRVIALRYHNVYGPGMPRDTPYSGVAAMFRSAIERGDRPRVFEDGRQQRDFVHVDDVARANLAAIDAVGSSDSFTAFNVASGRPIGIAEVATMVSAGRVTPKVTGEFRAGDIRHIVASPERARRELGFAATVSPEVGLPAFATAPLRG